VQLQGPIFETEWPKVSNCVSVPNFVAIGSMVLRCGDISTYQDGGLLPSCIFKFLKFLTVGWLKRAELHRRAKFGRNRSKRDLDVMIARFLKMAAAAILDFSNFKFLMVKRLKKAVLQRRAKCGRNRSKRGRDMAIFQFSQRTAMLALQALY